MGCSKSSSRVLDLVATGPKLLYLDRNRHTFKVTNPGNAPEQCRGNSQIPLGLPSSTRHRRAAGTIFLRDSFRWCGDDAGQSREVQLDVVQSTRASSSTGPPRPSHGPQESRAESVHAVGRSVSLAHGEADVDDTRSQVGADTAYEIRVTNTGSKTEKTWS